jgi:hypothetical protein
LTIANSSNQLKLTLTGLSYKPFISFYNLTDASVEGEELFGIGARFPLKS